MGIERTAILIITLPLVLAVALVFANAPASAPEVTGDGVKVFNLTGVAGSGVWTLENVNGLNYWWKRFKPATLVVERGDSVEINLRSADLLHCFYIPAFGVGPVDVEPGHTVKVRFDAKTAGVYQYYCTVMCGGCHFYMRGWLVVAEPGTEPELPPEILCPLCRPETEPRPEGADLVELGDYLYRSKGCITCHGPEGRGGIVNPNSVNSPVPAHNTTAQKLFLMSEEDAEAFIALVERVDDLGTVERCPEIGRYPVVRTRFENAKQIIRKGRYSSSVDPTRPAPPLQMPAWQYLIEEREIDALLVYFVSLAPAEEDTS